MAGPMTPVVGIALRYGVVAIASVAAARTIPKLRRNQKTEDVLDSVEEGVEFRRDENQISGTGRFRRIFQIGNRGPRFEIDATTLTRLRITRH